MVWHLKSSLNSKKCMKCQKLLLVFHRLSEQLAFSPSTAMMKQTYFVFSKQKMCHGDIFDIRYKNCSFTCQIISGCTQRDVGVQTHPGQLSSGSSTLKHHQTPWLSNRSRPVGLWLLQILPSLSWSHRQLTCTYVSCQMVQGSKYPMRKNLIFQATRIRAIQIPHLLPGQWKSQCSEEEVQSSWYN